MKKMFLLLVSAFVLSATIYAQDSTTAHRHDKGTGGIRQQRMDVMHQLNLTDEQKAKMQQLREEQRTKMDSIRNSSLGEDEKMAQIKMLRETNRKAMEEVLTPAQRSKMQDIRKQQMENRKAQKEDADSTR